MERIIFEKHGKMQHQSRCERCDFFTQRETRPGCDLPRDMDCKEGFYLRTEKPEPEALSLSDATILFKVMHENQGLLAVFPRDELYERLRLRLTSALPGPEDMRRDEAPETIKREDCERDSGKCGPGIPDGWEQFTPLTGKRTRYTCPSCIEPF